MRLERTSLSRTRRAKRHCTLRLLDTNPHEIINLLLDYGADINAKGSYGSGWKPLHFAVHNGNRRITRLLIEKGATEFKDMI